MSDETAQQEAFETAYDADWNDPAMATERAHFIRGWNAAVELDRQQRGEAVAWPDGLGKSKVNDEIKLPPFPSEDIMDSEIRIWTVTALQAYARADVELDRQQRGEAVASSQAPVGEAMPAGPMYIQGSTIAVFEADEVPAGTKLYRAPVAAQPVVTDEMIDRFLSWGLPDDFAPDYGVTFTRLLHPNNHPTGTNHSRRHRLGKCLSMWLVPPLPHSLTFRKFRRVRSWFPRLTCQR
jgi:hypothetical protein